MAVVVGDILQLSFRGTQAGQRIMMVRTYRCSIAAPNTTYTEDMGGVVAKISAGALGGMRGRYLSLLPTAYTLNEIRAQVISPVRRVQYSVLQVGQLGTNGGVGNVTNLAAVITMRTALAGRDQVANAHIGPIPSDISSAGSLDATYRLTMSDLKDIFLQVITPDGFDVASWTPCIYHSKAVLPAPRYNDIASAIVQTTTRTMRRRTVGRGE